MNRPTCFALTALAMCIASSHAQVADDFSKGGWSRFSSTPGTMSAEKGKLHLVDGPDGPRYVTVSKTFTVDVDKTPLFVVMVADASDRGTIKLIRKEPYDKKVAIEIDRPGLYSLDMRKRFGWRGTIAIQTCLYAIGDESEITYAYVRFAEQLTPEEQELIKNRGAGGNVPGFRKA